jgi:hypothetical protein
MCGTYVSIGHGIDRSGVISDHFLEMTVRAIVAALALLICAEARAQTIWTEVVNGDVVGSSMVKLYADGSKREFRYSVPDRRLPVKPGTLLFSGMKNGNVYAGKALAWTRRCGSLSYDVSGTVSEDQRRVTLYGKAPQIDQRCKVVSYRDEVLAFNFVDLNANIPGRYDENPAAPGAAVAQPQPMQPTLVCSVPEFTEEHRLKQRIDGNRATTIWVAQAINYLRGKYCVVLSRPPQPTDQTSFGDGCGEDKGYYLGELVYWGECHE